MFLLSLNLGTVKATSARRNSEPFHAKEDPHRHQNALSTCWMLHFKSNRFLAARPILLACPAPCLVVGGSAHGELEATDTTGQFSVHLRVGVESVVDATSLLLVQDNLQNLASIFLGPEALSNNLDWVDNIGEDCLVDGGQSSAARALLSLRGAGSVGALGARQDAARCEDQDVAVGELLLELTGQALLDLVEAGEERDGDEDDNGTFSVADLEL